jgi:hypothetical protein
MMWVLCLFRTRLWVLPRPRHVAKCWLSIQCFIFLFMFCLETPKNGSDPTNFLNRTVSYERVGDFISSYPSMSRDSTYSHYVLSYPSISRDPIYSHFVAGRYIIQRPLPLCANREVVWRAWRTLRAALISDWLIYCMEKSPSLVVHRSQGIFFCLWDLKYNPLVHKCQFTPTRNRTIDSTRAILFL